MEKTYKKLNELKEWDKNPRSISPAGFERLKKQITKLGQYKPLLITNDGVVLGGNMRLKAYRELGVKDIWVSIVDAPTEEKRIEYALSDNDRAGQYEGDQLSDLVGNFPDVDYGEFAVDIKPPIILKNLMDQYKEVEEDEAPAVVEGEAESKLGEVYTLGRHRLMCGDSTKKDEVEKLMNGQKADMVFTDPPYGVDYSGLGQNTNSKIENDNLSVNDTRELVNKALENAYNLANEGATCFVWHADSKQGLRPAFEDAFIKSGWRLAATIIWAKKQASMGFQDYRSQHEPCLYGWKGTKANRVSDRTQTTLWETGRDGDYKHPTQKPVFLASTAIQNHKPNIVLDLFGGSGSTLIACEQTNRVCYMMELDPKYCDVIRKRYQNFVDKQNNKI